MEMSQAQRRIPYRQAKSLAERIKKELSGCCERIEIAGSIRRRRGYVGDIEMVAIPIFHPSLFDNVQGENALLAKLNQLVQRGRLKRANNGTVLPKFHIPALDDFKLEVMIVDKNSWAVALAIATGPKEFSKKLVTKVIHGGFLPSDCTISDGWKVIRDGNVVPLATEREFLEFCECGWLPPNERLVKKGVYA